MEESDLAEYHPNILLDKAALTSWLEAGLSWKINEALFSTAATSLPDSSPTSRLPSTKQAITSKV